jgi:hypothetical protein
MKKFIKLTAALLTFTLLTISLPAQTPPPPNNGNGNPGGGNTPVGGGAPVGTGLAILAALGLGYGGRKIYKVKKQDLPE